MPGEYSAKKGRTDGVPPKSKLTDLGVARGAGRNSGATNQQCYASKAGKIGSKRKY